MATTMNKHQYIVSDLIKHGKSPRTAKHIVQLLTDTPARKPVIKHSRLFLQTRRISKKEAQEIRNKEIQNVLCDFREAKQKLQELRAAPLPKTIEEHVEVFPGDSRYEKSAYGIRAEDFAGRWSFKTNL